MIPSAANPVVEACYYSRFLRQQTDEQRDRLEQEFLRELAMFSLEDYALEFNEIVLSTLLGEGAFGEVYKGRYRGRDVAVKLFRTPPDGSNDMHMLKSFVREVNALRRTGACKNIIKLVGACYQPLCIVTELMDCSLFDLLHKKHTPLSMPEVLDLCFTIAEGMSYLHNLEPPVIHRDLTSENILLDKEKGFKIADFGVSRMVESAEELKPMTPTGNPRWRAPEIGLGFPYSTKADVFSFGVVLWECLTNSVPFRDLPDTECNHSVSKLDIPHFDEAVCPGFRRLLVRCLDSQPDARPTFDHILEKLERISESMQLEVLT